MNEICKKYREIFYIFAVGTYIYMKYERNIEKYFTSLQSKAHVLMVASFDLHSSGSLGMLGKELEKVVPTKF